MVTRLVEALFRVDPTEGFVQYVQTVKPYHTKILEVLVEYVWTDQVNVSVCERHNWDMVFTRPQPNVVYDCNFGVIWDTPYGYATTTFFINGVTTGLGGSWRVAGNHVALFSTMIGDPFVVGKNVGGGSGYYIIGSVALSGSDTVITIQSVLTPAQLTAGFQPSIIATATPHGIIYVYNSNRINILDSSAFEEFKITAVTPALTLGTWTIAGNHADRFVPGTTFRVQSNTDLSTDTEYTIVSATNGLGTTTITVLEEIPTTYGFSGIVVDAYQSYLITFVEPAPTLGTWTIDGGDFTSRFVAGYPFQVQNNSEPLANIFYTTVSSSFFEGRTTIVVTETIPATVGMSGVIIDNKNNSFLVQGDLTETFFEGSYVAVENSINGNNGLYIGQASILEGANTRFWVKEPITKSKPDAAPYDGRMYLANQGYDVPPYCRLLQAPDLHADTFISERLTFNITMGGEDRVGMVVLENQPRGWGVSPYGSPFGPQEGHPPTVPTTGITLLPTGLEGQYFDMGGFDENLSTVTHFYGRSIP